MLIQKLYRYRLGKVRCAAQVISVLQLMVVKCKTEAVAYYCAHLCQVLAQPQWQVEYHQIAAKTERDAKKNAPTGQWTLE